VKANNGKSFPMNFMFYQIIIFYFTQ